MKTCEYCGCRKLEGESNQVGPYCDRCLVKSIESVFVHASDQPLRKTPVVSNQAAPANQRWSEGTASHSSTDRGHAFRPTQITNIENTNSIALQRPKRVFQRHASINIRPMQQIQMLNSFLNDYFPTAEARASLADRRSYLSALPDMQLASNPLVRVAIDTLCFAHIGAKTGDNRFIRESQTSYGRVLNSLIQATKRPPTELPHINPKAVITSIMLMCLYDEAVPNPSPVKDAWAAHYWGCEQLLRAYGSAIFDVEDPFDRLLFLNLRMPIFFVGIVKRKNVVLANPEWLAPVESLRKTPSSLTRFYRSGMRIPALLEHCDNLLEPKHPQENSKSLCLEILKTRSDILAWYENRDRGIITLEVDRPETFHIENERNASKLLNEEHCYMATSTVFTTFYRFTKPGSVREHTLKLLCLLILDCTLLRLLYFRPGVAEYVKPWLPQDIENNAFDEACDLCRSVHHYASLETLAYADFTEFLTEMALSFFDEVGKAKELGWCIAVRSATKLRKERLKKTIQVRTLCRVADAGPGFAAATRFKSHNIFSELSH